MLCSPLTYQTTLCFHQISQLVSEREELESRVHHQKLQLRNCKAEVAALQEAARAKTEQLQEVGDQGTPVALPVEAQQSLLAFTLYYAYTLCSQ